MPLVWISVCHRSLGHLWSSDIYLLLTAIADAIDSKGRINPRTVQPRSWIRQQSLTLPLLPETLRPALGLGEREVICLAVEVRASAIILDDEPARKTAAQLKLPIIGTAGVLLLAEERQLTPSHRIGVNESSASVCRSLPPLSVNSR